jgi:hypothetical protein
MQAALGWPVFFLVTAAAGLPTFLLLWVMERRKARLTPGLTTSP